ncbi:MAG TPA: AAA family ATPase [Acidimicrobiales bacterium]|jgi:hypothetical protein|nr:AAA family ATPase [Acidimicrobiales bacterium]
MTKQNSDYEVWSTLYPHQEQPSRPAQPGRLESVPTSAPERSTSEGREPWVAEGRTAWEATLEQEEELRTTYPGGKDQFFARLWDEPSRSDLERFGPLCGVSLNGRSPGSSGPDAEASPEEMVEGLRLGTLSPQLVSAEVVAGVVRQIPRDLWLRGNWEDMIDHHGEGALELAERVRAIEAHRAQNRLRQAIITEDSGSLMAPVDWLIEDMVVAGDLVAVIGRKSAGKSTLAAVDLACSVATGAPWIGHRVRQGKVIVFVAEGSSGAYQAGVRAWRAEHPDAGDPWSHLLPVVERISLVGPQTNDGDHEGDMDRPGAPAVAASPDVQHALELIGEEQPTLVIIDDLVACMEGRSDMSPADISSVLSAMQNMAGMAGSTVLVVHHTDYDGVKAQGLQQFEDGMSAIAHIKTRTNSTERFVECYKPSRLDSEWRTVKLRLVPKGSAAVFVPTTASDTDAIHGALDGLGVPSGKNAILEQAREQGFGLNRNRALRLIDELADDPDDLVAKDGIKYYLEGSLG